MTQPLADCFQYDRSCWSSTKLTSVDWPGCELDPLEALELARRLAGRGRVAQVELGHVRPGAAPVLVTVALTRTWSCRTPSRPAGPTAGG